MSMPETSNGRSEKAPVRPGLLWYRPLSEPGRNQSVRNELEARVIEAIKATWTDVPTSTPPLLPPIDRELLIYWHEKLLSAIEPEEVVGRFREVGETSLYEVWEDGEPPTQHTR